MRFGRNSTRRYSYIGNKRMQKLQKTIDMLAYGSLLLDIFIALITALSLLNITTGELILVPIHYMLTAVVLMSLVSGGMLLYLRHYENIMTEFLRIKYKIKMPLPSPRTRYTILWAIRRKLRKIYNSLRYS